jgi:hypothetical protein
MSVNILIDTIFVGQWMFTCDYSGCCCFTYYLLDFTGMAIGIGGGSVLSRALEQKIVTKQTVL